MESPRPGKLQIDEALDYQRRCWIVQRVSWWVLAAFIAGAMMGAFGHGPLSHARAGDASAFGIEHERIVRRDAPTELRFIFRLRPRQMGRQELTASLGEEPALSLTQLSLP